MKRSSPGLALKMSVSCREGNSKFRVRAEKSADCEKAQRAIDPEKKGGWAAKCFFIFDFFPFLWGTLWICNYSRLTTKGGGGLRTIAETVKRQELRHRLGKGQHGNREEEYISGNLETPFSRD